MFWFVRAAWGCLFTAYLLGGDGHARWRTSVDGGEFWALMLITVVGFGPAFMPASRWKVAGLLWGMFVSYGFLLGNERNTSTFLFLAWGPLLIPTAIVQARRAFGEGSFVMGRSVLRDARGRKADWTFAARGVEIAVDLESAKLRIRAQKAWVYDASFTAANGPAIVAYPLLDCDFRFTEVIETKHHNVTGMVYGTTTSGERVSMVVPQEGYSTDHHTGRYVFTVAHRPKELRIAYDHVSAAADGTVQYHGRVEEGIGKHLASISLDNLSKHDSARLMSIWSKEVEPLIEQAKAARAAALLSERKAATTDAYLRDVSAKRERKEREAQELRDRTLRGAALVAARIDGLRDAASIGEGFREVSHDIDGVVGWAIVADRAGRAAIIDARGDWAGSLAGARAWIDVVEKGEGKSLDTLELVVQVDDAAFEAEHFSKRRLRIMRGQSNDSLMTWVDRVSMLSKIGVDRPAPFAQAGAGDAKPSSQGPR